MTPTDPRPTDAFDRRRFLTLGAGAGLTALAGCSSGPTAGTGGSDGGSASGPSAESTGGFRLLISDQPSAIGDFDSLVVTLSEARVFRAGGDEDEEDGDVDETTTEETPVETTEEPTTEETTTTTEESTTTAEETTTTTTAEDTTDDSSEGDDEEEDADEDDGDDDVERGFSVLDLGGRTVDLTTVVGEKATGVFDGELAEGRYTKVELHVTQVDGVVEGDGVDVKLPSEKLQITKNFEVVAGETLSFVFDITVVKKGQGGYNLLPVISESGVAGRDVQVEEVGPDAQDGGDGGDRSGDGEDGAGDDGDGGPPDSNPGNASAAGTADS